MLKLLNLSTGKCYAGNMELFEICATNYSLTPYNNHPLCFGHSWWEHSANHHWWWYLYLVCALYLNVYLFVCSIFPFFLLWFRIEMSEYVGSHIVGHWILLRYRHVFGGRHGSQEYSRSWCGN